ncbi:MAG TPA: hypothetical protein VFV50_08845 [Bdellovibrionales bacterium]|nr:hypothetical protein [Bdellovibrionales bacterium]
MKRFKLLTGALALFLAVACGPGNLRFAPESDLSSMVDPGLLEASSQKLRLGGRDYIASVLNDVFGSTAVAITDALIKSESGNFGGPCDRYLGDCTEAGESQFAIIPVPTSPRAALLIRACDRLVSNDTAVTFAASQARANPAATLQRPSEEELSALFDLFYPGRPITPEIIANLNEIVIASAGQNQPALDAWRFTLFALCVSPGWQVP